MNEMTAGEAAEELYRISRVFDTTGACSYAASILSRVASGELGEVEHAHWIVKQDMEDRKGLFIRIVCSNCDLHTGMKSKFCPTCGALMDGDSDA